MRYYRQIWNSPIAGLALKCFLDSYAAPQKDGTKRMDKYSMRGTIKGIGCFDSLIGSCGGNTIGVLDFSPTFIIKPYHQKGGTEVPPYDIDKLLFVGLPTKNLNKFLHQIH